MLHPAVKKFESSLEGFGLVATQRLPRGTVVCAPAAGENIRVLTHRELRRLPREFHHLAYRHKDHYVLTSDGSEYMNHSCDPNLWWVDDDTLEASRDIEPGDEVTFDYSTSEVHPWWRPKWVCRCGAPNCRRIISGRDCLDPAFQRRHEGHMPSWALEFIARNRGWRGAGYAALASLAEIVRRTRSLGKV